jgi:ABC-type phosphate transport system substrate-binding protein
VQSRKLLLAAVFLAYLSATPAWAGEIVAVIVNKENPVDSLTAREIGKIYRNHTLMWTGDKSIILYDLMVSDPVREAFSQQVLGMSADKMADKWAHLKITNQAKNPPHTMKSQRLIIKRISKQRRAIGYVSMRALKAADDPNVKPVFVIQ